MGDGEKFVTIVLIAAILLLCIGCGVDVKVAPVTGEIKHTFQINFDSILSYCNNKCAQQYASQTEIDACANQCFADFVDILNHALPRGPYVR